VCGIVLVRDGIAMKLHIFSDCHFEFHRDGGESFINSLKPNQNEIAIIAGDLSSIQMLEKSFSLLCKQFGHVIFVCGNHELYGGSPSKLAICKSKIDFLNLHWLDNSFVEIDGQRFIGSTLWFPRPNNVYAKKGLNDFVKIKDFEPWVYEQNDNSIEFLQNELRSTDILISHHFPFKQSIHPEFKNSTLNQFFFAGDQVESIVMEKKPYVTIHGHTHSSFDYEIMGGMRVVCNPFGYAVYDENPAFDYNKII